MPRFILSGQPQYENDVTFSDTYGEYYKKSNPNDVIRLFTDIKTKADKQPLTQIRHKYQNVFDVCSEKYIGEAASKNLMPILYSIENPLEKFEDETYYNDLRQIVDLVFWASLKIGILHDKCINKDGTINVTTSRLFMSGDTEGIAKIDRTMICSKNYFPKILARNLESILVITHAGSHGPSPSGNTKKPTLLEYKNQIKSNFLLYSTTLQVMDLLLWFKKYADENPDIEKNKSAWKV